LHGTEGNQGKNYANLGRRQYRAKAFGISRGRQELRKKHERSVVKIHHLVVLSLWNAKIPSVLSSDREVGTYLLSFSTPQDQKSDRKPSQFGCLCAILAPHVTALPQRGSLMHFVL
jgi:hypothetical protein